LIIDKYEIKAIKACNLWSVAPRHLAEYYNVPLYIISDILGLPRDKKEMEKIHRENNFYNHGKGDKNLEFRINHYSLYLLEGDFEKYQQYCYMSHYNPLFWITKWRVHIIKKSDIPSKERRRLWLVMRFESYQEGKWAELEAQCVEVNKLLDN